MTKIKEEIFRAKAIDMCKFRLTVLGLCHNKSEFQAVSQFILTERISCTVMVDWNNDKKRTIDHNVQMFTVVLFLTQLNRKQSVAASGELLFKQIIVHAYIPALQQLRFVTCPPKYPSCICW